MIHETKRELGRKISDRSLLRERGVKNKYRNTVIEKRYATWKMEEVGVHFRSPNQFLWC